MQEISVRFLGWEDPWGGKESDDRLMTEWLSLHCTAGGNDGIAAMENSMEVPQKIKN